jgi:Sulfotransferase family
VRTKPFFIVSSGRSGTAMLHKALSAAGDIEMHHEFAVNTVQPLGVRRYLDLIDRANALEILNNSYLPAIAQSSAARWGDSSNKLSWLIPELAELIPAAKFVHLVRDGRKVASSYFHKLGDECYDDRSNAILQAHYDDPVHVPAPPPEKKYWWPVPRHDDPMAQGFRGFDQFRRIAWHWAQINKVILISLAALTPERHLFVRLEDLVSSPRLVRSLFEFLETSYRDELFAVFARPHNVNRPEDCPLTTTQRAAFERIASPMMERLGYAERAEYVVNY